MTLYSLKYCYKICCTVVSNSYWGFVLYHLTLATEAKSSQLLFFKTQNTVGSISDKSYAGSRVLRNHSSIFSRKMHRYCTHYLAAGSKCSEVLPRYYFILIDNSKKNMVESFMVLRTWKDSGKICNIFASVLNSFLFMLQMLTEWLLKSMSFPQLNRSSHFCSKGNTFVYKCLKSQKKERMNHTAW